MAERRMFAKTIIDSDAFLDMPTTSQLLYFHMAMRADDDGFINRPKSIMRMIGASQDDAEILIRKKFIIPFESGIVVIKHWRIHNYIRNDRYKETNYKDEKNTLMLDKNKAYTACTPMVDELDTCGIPLDNQMSTNCTPMVGELDTQVRIGKDSLNNNIYIGEIVAYLNEKAGTNYKATTKDTVSYINARLSDGFTVDDFKTVIDKKVKDWQCTAFEKYLRPKTLFGTKFESYLNEKVTTKPEKERLSDLDDIF